MEVRVRLVRHRPIRVSIRAPGAVAAHAPQLGVVEDLSETGMYFSCSSPLLPGAEVTIVFDLPTPRREVRVWVRAQVRHQQHKHGRRGMGLQFLRLEFDHAQLIRALVLLWNKEPDLFRGELAAL